MPKLQSFDAPTADGASRFHLDGRQQLPRPHGSSTAAPDAADWQEILQRSARLRREARRLHRAAAAARGMSGIRSRGRARPADAEITAAAPAEEHVD